MNGLVRASNASFIRVPQLAVCDTDGEGSKKVHCSKYLFCVSIPFKSPANRLYIVKSTRNLDQVHSRIPFKEDRPPKVYIQLSTKEPIGRTKTALRGLEATWNESFPVCVLPLILVYISNSPISVLEEGGSLTIEAFHDGRHTRRNLGKVVLTNLEANGQGNATINFICSE